MKLKRKLFALLFIGLMLAGCGRAQTPESAPSEDTGETISEEPFYVTFEANTIEDEAVTSDIFANSKLTMINVWATYCNPCLKEMPDLAQIATSYDSADFQLLGVISDITVYSEEDALSEAKELIEQTGATTYPHLILNQSLYANLIGPIDSVPTTFFVNQEGELLGYVVGSRDKESWESIINEILAEME